MKGFWAIGKRSFQDGVLAPVSNIGSSGKGTQNLLGSQLTDLRIQRHSTPTRKSELGVRNRGTQMAVELTHNRKHYFSTRFQIQ